MLPSEVVCRYWAVTYEDLRYKIKIKISQEMAALTQHYESFGLVVSQVLGGESEETKPKVKPTENWAEAELAARALFS